MGLGLPPAPSRLQSRPGAVVRSTCLPPLGGAVDIHPNDGWPSVAPTLALPFEDQQQVVRVPGVGPLVREVAGFIEELRSQARSVGMHFR
eukprot:15135550-Alexandrium_andersonii.AAC.1